MDEVTAHIMHRKTVSMEATWAQDPCRRAAEDLVEATQSVDFDVDGLDHFGSQCVLREQSPIRLAWSAILLFLIGYTATVFLYRFSFCLFHIGETGIEPVGEDGMVWNVIDVLVDVLFWVDLFMNFFITYTDFDGREVDNLKKIAKRYLSFHFWLNLMACLPENFYNVVASASDVDFRVARVYRLHRIQKLVKLARMARLVKLVQLTGSNSRVWLWLSSNRYVRFLNFILGLFLCLHMLACGWYICAALHEDFAHTWVARRAVDDSGTTLIGRSPFEQWLHSMYFMMTVFTTVGFGDISAFTEAEIIYVLLTMLVGAVVHSIIIGKVIGLVTSVDEVQRLVDKQISMIDSYTAHCHLKPSTAQAMKKEITWRAKNWTTSAAFDKAEMADMIMGKYIPRWLIAEVPESLFDGALVRNNFFRKLTDVPPRLPCLLAVHLVCFHFGSGEVVYQKGDFSFNIFLVRVGTFAHIGRPGPEGGVDAKDTAELKVCGDGYLADHSRKSSREILKHAMSTQKKPSRSSSTLSSLLKDRGPRRPSGSAADKLHPYRLFSQGSYFGDGEIMSGMVRFSTVKCMRRGTCLTLNKSDFAEIQAIFPQYCAFWARTSQDHERLRLSSLARLRRGMDYRSLAVLQIQRFWHRRGGRCRDSTSLAPTLRRHDAAPKPLPYGGIARVPLTGGNCLDQLPNLRKGRHFTTPFSQDSAGPRRDSDGGETKALVNRLRLDMELLRKDTQASVDGLRGDIGDLRAEIRELLASQRRPAQVDREPSALRPDQISREVTMT